MKVKDLINSLSQYNQELDIIFVIHHTVVLIMTIVK